MNPHDRVICVALQRYLVQKRIEAAHKNKPKEYATLLSAIEEVCDNLRVPRDDATLDAIHADTPGCHHV